MKKSPISHLLGRFCAIAGLLAGTWHGEASSLFWDINGGAPGAGGSSPSGTWDNQSSVWASSPTGDSATSSWVANSTAVFAAGNEATGAYTVNLGAAQSADGIVVEDGNVTISGSNALMLTGNATIDVQSGRGLMISAPMGGTVGLNKTGSGVLNLSGSKAFSGNVVINDGLLMVQNGSGSATGSGNVQVNAGAGVKGTGIIAGAVALDGTVSPGVGAGTLSTGSQQWNGGATYLWEINDALGEPGISPGWDIVEINGSLALNADSTNRITLNLNTINAGGSPSLLQNFDNTWSFQWTIVKTTGGISNFSPDKFSVVTSGFLDSIGSGVFRLALSADGKDLVLHFAQFPQIDLQPVSQTKEAGEIVFFSVNATGSVPLSYQWKKDGVAIVNDGRIAGAASTSLSISTLTSGDAGQYTVVASNIAGTATSEPATLTVASCTPIPDNLVSWWKAESTSVDENGANAATLNNGASYASAKVGNGFYLDGTNDYVQSSANGMQFGFGDFTVEGWLKTAATNYFSTVFSFGASAPSLYIRGDLGGALEFGGFGASFDDGFNDGTFHHFAVVRSSGWITLFMDGTEVGGFSGSSEINPTTFLLGSDTTAGNQFSGILDEVAVYNRALAPAEISALFGATSYGKCVGVGAPTIVSQPSSQTKIAGDTATFSVQSTGALPLTYTWRKNGTNLTEGYPFFGVTSRSLTILNVTSAEEAAYTVQIANGQGSITSDPATLTVRVPPTILAPIASVTNAVGATATFTVSATATSPLNYQWRVNGTNLVNGGRFSGVHSSSLMISDLKQSDAGFYSCFVSNADGSAVAAAILEVVFKPRILTQPLSQTNNAGVFALFSVAAEGGALQYQWKKGTALLADGTKYSGTKTPNLFVNNLRAADAGNYTVVITNSAGSTNSAIAKLGVRDPAINVQPSPAERLVGANVTFTVGAAGTGTLLFQWQKDGVNLVNGGAISGATSPNLTITNITAGHFGAYRVTVSNTRGSVTSANATLSISQPPSIVGQPQSITNPPGGNAIFNVTVAGTPPFGFQWQKDGVNLVDNALIFGSSGSSLLVSNLRGTDNGSYTVVITNEAGTVTSSAATLTVSNLPPHVEIVSPTDGTVLPGPGNFSVVANAFDTDGTIDHVEFYVNGNLVETLYTPPYIHQATNVPGGVYSAEAVAVDNLGGGATSETMTVQVNGDCNLAPNGAISWWAANDNGNDRFGRNNGVLVSEATINESGYVGSAYDFNGTGAVLVVPHSESVSFAPGERMTVELWAYRTGSNPVGRLLGKRTPVCGDSNYELSYDDTGEGSTLRFGADTGTGFSGVAVPSVLPMNQWTHLAGTYDGTTFRLYVNGIEVGTAEGSLGPTNSDPLKIGGSGGCDYFAGLLDEITLYNRALGTHEIQQIYAAGTYGKCENPLKLEAMSQLGAVGDQRGTGIAIREGAAYVAGYSQGFNDEGLIARFNLPLVSAPTTNFNPRETSILAPVVEGPVGPGAGAPIWSTNWPGLFGTDRFHSIAASSDGIYAAGESYARTTDVRGDKEGKGIVVKFPFGGPVGGGFGGSIWERQAPASPGAYGISGREVILATTVSVEEGISYIYATGYSQSSLSNTGRVFVTKMRTDSTILWTVRDESFSTATFSAGRAITVFNGHIYVAGHTQNDQGITIAVVSKYDLTGNHKWTLGRDPGVFYGITAHGGAIYTAGRTGDQHLIEKRDEAGAVFWSKKPEMTYPEGLNAVIGFGGKIYAAGWSSNFTGNQKEAVILEISAETGDVGFVQRYASPDAGDAEATSIATDGMDLYVVGQTFSWSTGNDAMILRYRVSQPEVELSMEANLPTAEVGKPYSVNLAASGGQPPYSWAVSSGTLPDGLVFNSNGSIAGVPTEEGTSSLTLQVQDSAISPQVISATVSLVVLESNDIPVVTITSPTLGHTFESPANFEVAVTVSDSDTINGVNIYLGSTRINTDTEPPYTADVTNLAPGTYVLTAAAQDSVGAVGTSTPVFIRVNAPGTYLIDFEPLDTSNSAKIGAPVVNYLANHRIGLTNETTGSTFVVDSSARIAGGNAVVASSGRNIFTQAGVNGRVSYTIGFAEPVGRFEFTRANLLSALRGITHPAWRATAYDASGIELSSVFEDLITSYNSIPARTFALHGPDISWIRIEADNRGVAAFSSALLDDFVLYDDVGNLPPFITIDSPRQDETFSAPANVTITATASDTDGTVANISFYAGEILLGSTSDNPGSVTFANLAPGTYFVKAIATDDAGASRSSQLRRFVVSPAPGVSMINFDALDATRNVGGISLSNYLAAFGVKITGPTIGSRVEVMDFKNLAGGGIVMPPSPRNVLGQVGVDGPMAFTLRFETPMQSVQFTRPLLKGAASSVIHPAWTARAFDVTGTEIAVVSESEINSFDDVPARTFELRKAGIAWVRFESQGGKTTFPSVLIDNVVLNSNPLLETLSARIISPTEGANYISPADILVQANVEHTAAVDRVEFYAGVTRIGTVSGTPYELNWSNVLPGSYSLRAKVYDILGNAVWSAPVGISVAPGVGGNATIVNFDAIDAGSGPVSGPVLVDYLATFGITVNDQTLGSTVQAVAQTSFLAGTSVQAASEPNVLTQTGSSDFMAYTLQFDEPLESFQFTRPKLRAGSAGITHPEWTARAYDANDVELDSVTEAAFFSYSDIGASIFVLQGQGIVKVRFESNNRRTTAFKAVLVDDMILTTSTSNLPPVVKITQPGNGNTFAAPATIGIVAEAFDHDGEITRVDFYNGLTLLGSDAEAPYSLTWSNVPIGRYTLRTVAFDNDEASKNAEPVRIVVEPRANVFGFLTHPEDQTVALGSDAAFSVTTTFDGLVDVPAITYQWTLNGTNLSGATQSTLEITGVDEGDAGSYAVTASCGGTNIVSDSALLSIASAPSIDTDPEGQSVNVGNTATFTVTATGAEPLRYQWLRNGNPIRNATSSAFSISSVKATDAGNYSVIVANALGSARSERANLLVTIGSGELSTADNFAARISFNPLAAPVFGNNSSATVEPGEPEHARKTGGKSIWYSWTASFTGVITLSTLGSSFDTLMAVYTGTDVANLSLVAANDDARDGYFTSQVTFYVVEGIEYQIAVDGFFGASGNVMLSMPDGGYRVLDVSGSDEELPNIVAQPEGSSLAEGTNYTLTVSVTSQTALRYQWFFNGLPLLDATNSLLDISDFDSAAVGRYYVLVANEVGSVESEIVQLQMISAEIDNTETVASQDKFLESVRTGITALAGRDSKGNTGNAGPSRGYTTTQIFSTVGSTKEEGEPNHAGEPGGASEWYVYAAPESGTLHINTDGSSFNTVLAVYRGSGLGFDTLIPVASNNGSSGNGGDRVRFSATQDTVYFIAVDGVGGITGTAKLNINLGTPPSITTPPVSKVVTIGSSSMFTVIATGTTNLTYQWRFNGANISGATGSSYTRSNIQLTHIGAYSVVVSNMINMATNAPSAYLQIESVPIVTVQPVAKTVVAGTNTTLSVTAVGSEPLVYQWYRNDEAVAGATRSALAFTGIQTTNNGSYSVVITNIVGAATSSVVAVTVSVPVPVVTSHKEGAAVSEESVVLAGTAASNARISQVLVQANDGAFTPATGIASWNANVNLIPGTNTLTVKAVDQSGFESTAIRKLFYSALYPFTLQINGYGVVTNAPMSFNGVVYRATNGAQLLVGKTYKLTASAAKTGPGTNYIFTNWTDHADQVIGTNAILNYVMTTDGHVNANFITNPFIATAGTYSGLFYEADEVKHSTAGYLLLKTTSKLAYSGKLFIDGNAVSVSGKFALPGTAEKTVLRMAKYGKPDLTFSIALDFVNGSDRITGSVSQGADWTAPLTADRVVWTTNRLANAYTNNYVFVIPPPQVELPDTLNPAAEPVGYGYALLSVNNLGKVKLAGGAADAHLLKQASYVSKHGEIAFFTPMYMQERTFNTKILKEHHGFAMGLLTLATNAPAGKTNLAPQGAISWIKTTWTNAQYSGGFTNEVTVLGSRQTSQKGVRLVNVPSGVITLEEGNLQAPINVGFNLSTNNAFTTNTVNPHQVKLAATATTGAFKGTFAHPQNPGLPTRYYGAFLQDYNYGRGYFAGTNQTGAVTFEAQD